MRGKWLGKGNDAKEIEERMKTPVLFCIFDSIKCISSTFFFLFNLNVVCFGAIIQAQGGFVYFDVFFSIECERCRLPVPVHVNENCNFVLIVCIAATVLRAIHTVCQSSEPDIVKCMVVA